MKKALALLLALMMCLSFAACGNATAESNSANKMEELIVGEWQFEGGNTLVCNNDHTGTFTYASGESYNCRWSYDEDLDFYEVMLVFEYSGKMIYVLHQTQDDVMKLVVGGEFATKQ